MQDLFNFYDEDEVTYCIFCDMNYPRSQISKHSLLKTHLENRIEALILRPPIGQRWCKESKEAVECPHLIEEVREGDLTITFECGIGFESTFTEGDILGIEFLIGDDEPHPMRPTSCIRSGGVNYQRR